MAFKVLLAGTADHGRVGEGTCPPLEKAFLDLNVSLGSPEDSAVLVNLNHNKSAFNEFAKNKRTDQRAFLVALEPISVFPKQYSEKILRKYSYSYFPGNRIRQGLSKDFLAWPYTFNENPASPKSSEQKLANYVADNFKNELFKFENWNLRGRQLVMIAANKVSPTAENLYGVRRHLAKSLKPIDFQLFGPLWNDQLYNQIIHRLAVLSFSVRSGYLPKIRSIFGDLGTKYPASAGVVRNKHLVLRDSKFSVVVENSSENITEKLFDSLINGAIPFYIGPTLENSGIPSGVAIEGISDAESILSCVREMSSADICNHLEAISDFLESPKFVNVWDSDLVYKQIATDIVNRFEASE